MRRMMSVTRRLATAITVVAGLASLGADDPQPEGMPVPELTEEHKRLAQEVGTWEAKIKSWMSPDAPPTDTAGTETNTLLKGGLWLVTDFQGKLGDAEFAGHGVNGYDAAKKKYVGTWVDSFSTSIMTMEGTYDKDTKTLTMTGTTVDPAGQEYETKTTTEFPEEGVRVFTMSMRPKGSQDDYIKAVEITYRKTK